MSLDLKITLLDNDGEIELSPDEIKPRIPPLDEASRFTENFEEHMPSARKPKRYDHVGVLLLSFDPKSDLGGMGNMDVSEEVGLSRSLSELVLTS